MKALHVLAAVIRNTDGHFLLSQRLAGKHLAGCWEFPGGKKESEESRWDCLKRELHEELGINLEKARPLIAVRHQYPEKHVLLDVWVVEQFSGTPYAAESQPLQWFPADALSQLELPEADAPVLKALALPDRYQISKDCRDGEQNHWMDFYEQRCRAYPGQILQLRCPSLSDAEYLNLLKRLQPSRQLYQTQVLINRPALWTKSQNACDGLHLSAREAVNQQWQAIAETVDCVSVSCHSVNELKHAQQLGAHCALLSPVLATATHPQSTPLGWTCFEQSVAAVNVPVYALGGMQPEHLQQAWQAGAQGIAGIRF